jgi:hypothetical protein
MMQLIDTASSADSQADEWRETQALWQAVCPHFAGKSVDVTSRVLVTLCGAWLGTHFNPSDHKSIMTRFAQRAIEAAVDLEAQAKRRSRQ